MPYKKTIIIIVLLLSLFAVMQINSSWINAIKSYFHDFTLDDYQALTNIVLGVTGLILGSIYFKKRIIIDERIVRDERIRKRTSYIYEELRRADSLIDVILGETIDSDVILSKSRVEVDKMLMMLNEHLDLNDTLFGFTEEEVASLLQVHSYIVNSELLFTANLEEMSALNKEEARIDFAGIMSEARTVCLRKMENV